MHELIDSHCHLDFDEFDCDRIEVLQRASSAGISAIIIPGVMRAHWQRISDMCDNHAHLHACYGLHPYMAAKHSDNDMLQLGGWLDRSNCIALGECGLDYRTGQADKHVQLKFFRAQLGLARSCGKPAVIHSVRATEDTIREIRKHPGIKGMVHSYSGSYEQAMQLIDMGFYISLGGSITYDNARRIRNTASRIPLSAILLETDAPDQPDAAHFGQRNEPAYLVNVLECLGELRDEPVAQIAEQTTINARKLFRV